MSEAPVVQYRETIKQLRKIIAEQDREIIKLKEELGAIHKI